MAYSISDLPRAREEFGEIFGIALGEVTDELLTALSGNIIVDIVLLDKVLRKRYICDDNKSLNEIVLTRFGQEGLDILDKLLEL